MKNFKSIAGVLFAFILFASCSNDDEATSYEKTDFVGTWELSNSTSADYEACSTNPPILEVGDAAIVFPVIGNGGCDSGDFEIAYEFNGQAFNVSLFGQSISYTIISVSETEFTWEDNFEGAQETWIRVN